MPSGGVRPICSIEDCNRPHLAKGFCYLHYHRWKRDNDLNAPVRIAEHQIGSERKEVSRKTGKIAIRVKTVRGWERKARIVYEQIYGVKLRLGDQIFHRNNDQMDFRPENLVLQTRVLRVIICSLCGARFVREFRRISRHNFCSVCLRGKKGWKRGVKRKRMIQVVCADCGRIFEVHPCRDRLAKYRGYHFYCPLCWKQRQVAKKIKLTCSRCGKVYYRWPSELPKGEVFCSRRCQRLPDTLIRKIKEVRRRHGWTYSRIACELGMSRGRVQRVMEGKLVPFSGGPNDVESAEVAEVG